MSDAKIQLYLYVLISIKSTESLMNLFQHMSYFNHASTWTKEEIPLYVDTSAVWSQSMNGSIKMSKNPHYRRP